MLGCYCYCPATSAVVVLNSHFHGQLLNAVLKLTATYLRYQSQGVPKRQTVGNAKLCLLPKKPFIHSESQSVSYLVRKANINSIPWCGTEYMILITLERKAFHFYYYFFGCRTKTTLEVIPPIVKDL